MAELQFQAVAPVVALNGGLFVSRGKGTHPARVIDSYELIFVRSGVLELFEEERRFRLGPGETLVLWPGRRHGGAAAYPADLSFFWIHFTIPPHAGDATVVKLRQSGVVSDPERLSELCVRFLDEQERVPRGDERLSLLLSLILLEIARGRSGEGAGGLAGRALAAKAREYLRVAVFDARATTASVAARLRCNPDYLGRVFKQTYGHGLTDEIHRERVRKARHLLLESRLTIGEIAAECAFGDIAFFRKVFRRLAGTTPSAFRRLHSHVHVNTE